ncbi:hypothetical protein B0T18DRAFT_404098 [Schizothecium vesticola]|uniref:Secreted protein n=1 Tax=Schizothecium vesticola TaxID=314040 RepID=A0AA40KAW1_9PEZI|nr:hypothetical protein B0T18DRAFT_404098 [Schizothecium vesticola]
MCGWFCLPWAKGLFALGISGDLWHPSLGQDRKRERTASGETHARKKMQRSILTAWEANSNGLLSGIMWNKTGKQQKEDSRVS